MPDYQKIKRELQVYCALPDDIKLQEYGYKTYGDFADDHGTTTGKLKKIREEPDFWDGVWRECAKYLEEELPNIVHSMIQEAKSGEGPMIRLAFKMAGKYQDKSTKTVKVQDERDNLDKLPDSEIAGELAGRIISGNDQFQKAGITEDQLSAELEAALNGEAVLNEELEQLPA